MLVRAGNGPTYQVGLTYRDAPLDGGEPWLIGTTEHSVLGRRWVYDGCGDPVYVAALTEVIYSGGVQADAEVDPAVPGDEAAARRQNLVLEVERWRRAGAAVE